MLLLAFKIAVVAYVYSVILTEPGMILSGFYKWIESFKLPDWLFKPLIDCYKCVAGQIALWVLVLGYIIKWTFIFIIIDYAFFICASILIVIIINKIYEWNLIN